MPSIRTLAASFAASLALVALALTVPAALGQGEAAKQEDTFSRTRLSEALAGLSEAICTVIALLCPTRIVIGGGVSLLGQTLFFDPLREFVAERVFKPFAGLTDIVPAALGEEVVVHGAIALARKRLA